MFGGHTFMFEPTLNLFSRYVSTVGSKQRYHSSRVCVDITGRDSCRFLYNVFILMQRRPLPGSVRQYDANFCEIDDTDNIIIDYQFFGYDKSKINLEKCSLFWFIFYLLTLFTYIHVHNTLLTYMTTVVMYNHVTFLNYNVIPRKSYYCFMTNFSSYLFVEFLRLAS